MRQSEHLVVPPASSQTGDGMQRYTRTSRSSTLRGLRAHGPELLSAIGHGAMLALDALSAAVRRTVPHHGTQVAPTIQLRLDRPRAHDLGSARLGRGQAWGCLTGGRPLQCEDLRRIIELSPPDGVHVGNWRSPSRPSGSWSTRRTVRSPCVAFLVQAKLRSPPSDVDGSELTRKTDGARPPVRSGGR